MSAFAVTERSCVTPLSKDEIHISDRCSHCIGKLFVPTREDFRYSVNTALVCVTSLSYFTDKMELGDVCCELKTCNMRYYLINLFYYLFSGGDELVHYILGSLSSYDADDGRKKALEKCESLYPNS